MGQGPSDWEKGVLAAAKWLLGEAKRIGEAENDGHAFHVLVSASSKLLEELTPDEEGTEPRVARQIATYVRERAGNHPTTITAVLRQLADEIEVLDWRQA